MLKIKIENPFCITYETEEEFQDMLDVYSNLEIKYRIGYRFKVQILSQTLDTKEEPYYIELLDHWEMPVYVNPLRADDNE